MNDIILKLKELMATLGETDYSLQNKAHISQSTIYRILEGKTSDPGVHKIDGIARAMGYQLALVPQSEYYQQSDYSDEVDSLSKIITLVESLAQTRGFNLTPEQKAELIMSNYKANDSKEELGLRLANLR